MKKPISQKQTADPRTWVEVDKENIKNNIKEFRKYIGKNTMMAGVVKSNAYGHGLFKFSKYLVELGIDWLVVDAVSEAVDLRKIGIEKPILVLGYTPPEFFRKAEEKNISLTISSFENIKALRKVKNHPSIHIKINSGMNRQGFQPEDTKKVLDKLEGEDIDIEGIYTHFAKANDPSSGETEKQIESFKKSLDEIKKRNINCLVHSGNTAGTIAFPEGHFDMARVGIGMHGLWPSLKLKEKFSDKLSLKPALKWKSVISETRNLPEGSKIGYGFIKTLEKDSEVAITPAGYWHGYPTQLSNKGEVYVNGKRASVIGKVSMNMMILDVTDINASVGDKVTIVGKKITANDIAQKAKIINYEVISRINPLIERRYI